MAISGATRCLSSPLMRMYCSSASKTMQAWQALQYGPPDVLQINYAASIPVLTRPDDVLIKVHAASVNPLDVMMLNGYGESIISMMRRASKATLNPNPFPLILGRDFSGEVVAIGKFRRKFKVGDEVFGVIGPQQSGSHAEFVKTSTFCIAKKPVGTSHVEAASFPYAALTAWSALSTFGNLCSNSTYGKRVLVIGGSGGVGTIAVQLLKAWGADVTAVCSTDAVEMVQNLGADYVIDYLTSDVRRELKQFPKYDFVLDTVGTKNLEDYLDVLRPWRNSKYVTTVSSLLQNADRHGLLFGNTKSLVEASCDTLLGLRNGHSVRWAYFIPNGNALKIMGRLIESKQINPVIDRVFHFDDTIEAYRKMVNGHARGKIVIDFSEKPEELSEDEQPTKDSVEKAAEAVETAAEIKS